ncbi:MAG: DUF4434 domain-containing protein [Verrucomicrobiota bacterium]
MTTRQNKFKIITGSFISAVACGIESQNWGRNDWRRQFDVMQAMGMDTVVIIRVGEVDSAMYKSKVMNTTIYEEDDLVELMFNEADRTGLKLYLGLYDTEYHWQRNDWDAEVAINKRLIEELWDKHKHHKSFYGWYITHEGMMEQHMPKIWKPLIQKIKTYDSKKKILVSPRYGGEKWYRGDSSKLCLTPELHYKHFDYIFGEMDGLIDYAAFMDGHTAFKSLAGFVEATHKICKRHKVGFWSNLEAFDRDQQNMRFPPIEWMKMRFKLEVVQPYVEKIIAFEASKFLSPYSMFISARNLYERYLEYIDKKGRFKIRTE